MSIETDKFDALYKRLKPHGVTMTALLAKAVGAALAKHPVMFAGTRKGHSRHAAGQGSSNSSSSCRCRQMVAGRVLS
jgi:hypothetical protein